MISPEIDMILQLAPPLLELLNTFAKGMMNALAPDRQARFFEIAELVVTGIDKSQPELSELTRNAWSLDAIRVAATHEKIVVDSDMINAIISMVRMKQKGLSTAV